MFRYEVFFRGDDTATRAGGTPERDDDEVDDAPDQARGPEPAPMESESEPDSRDDDESGCWFDDSTGKWTDGQRYSNRPL